MDAIVAENSRSWVSSFTGSIQRRGAVGASGAVGGMFAALADVVQKEEASAIGRISYSLELAFGSQVALIHVILLVVGLATALCLVFEPNCRKRAFYVGASVLTLVMTMVPYGSVSSMNLDQNGGPPDTHGPVKNLERTETTSLQSSLRAWLAPVTVLAQARRPYGSIELELKTPAHGPLPSGRILLKESSRRDLSAVSWNRPSESRKRVRFKNLPAREYILRVEIPGYKIVEKRVKVNRRGSIGVSIRLKSTTHSLTYQRVFGIVDRQ